MIQKKLWFMWLQGLEEAPHIVKECYKSWQRRNPQWELQLLTQENLSDYVTIDLPDKKIQRLPINAYADLIRLKLLIDHGGVWTDATTFCITPLDDWLPEHLVSGYFSFSKPGPDRIMSSWFLAAEPTNYLLNRMYQALIAYWRDNSLSNRYKGPLITPFDKFLNTHPRYTKYWFSFFVLKIMRIYPYFHFHYMFAKLVEDDLLFAKIWDETPKIPADIPHKILHSKMLQPLTTELKEHIDSAKSPLYKLSWKYDHNKYHNGCTLHYLLSTLSEPHGSTAS